MHPPSLPPLALPSSSLHRSPFGPILHLPPPPSTFDRTSPGFRSCSQTPPRCLCTPSDWTRSAKLRLDSRGVWPGRHRRLRREPPGRRPRCADSARPRHLRRAGPCGCRGSRGPPHLRLLCGGRGAGLRPRDARGGGRPPGAAQGARVGWSRAVVCVCVCQILRASLLPLSWCMLCACCVCMCFLACSMSQACAEVARSLHTSILFSSVAVLRLALLCDVPSFISFWARLRETLTGVHEPRAAAAASACFDPFSSAPLLAAAWRTGAAVCDACTHRGTTPLCNGTPARCRLCEGGGSATRIRQTPLRCPGRPLGSLRGCAKTALAACDRPLRRSRTRHDFFEPCASMCGALRSTPSQAQSLSTPSCFGWCDLDWGVSAPPLADSARTVELPSLEPKAARFQPILST